MLNLDTHIVIDLLVGHLSPQEDALVRNKKCHISGIVLWEVFKLQQLGRIDIDLKDAELRRFFNAIRILPIDFDVLTAVKTLDFQSDPADEIIAATSLAYNIPLLTRDRRIKKSKIVPIA